MGLWRWFLSLLTVKPSTKGLDDERLYEPERRRQLDETARNTARAAEAKMPPF
jgi:hypothetical protein